MYCSLVISDTAPPKLKKEHDKEVDTPQGDAVRHDRVYSNVVILPVLTAEPTHIYHRPANRTVVASSADYVDHVLPKPTRGKPSSKSIKSKPDLQSSISVTIINPDLSEIVAELENAPDLKVSAYENVAEDEELEELPRFRPRVSSYDTEQVAISVANIRKKKISQDLELLRLLHEQNLGIDVFNELREKVPKKMPSPGVTEENTSSVVSNAELDFGQQLNDEGPIYAEPDKPKTSNVNRSNAENLLSKFNVGDFLIRQNKGTTIISVKVHNKIKHIKLDVQKEYIKVGKESFLNISELIQFYREQSPVSQTVSSVFLQNEIRFKQN